MWITLKLRRRTETTPDLPAVPANPGDRSGRRRGQLPHPGIEEQEQSHRAALPRAIVLRGAIGRCGGEPPVTVVLRRAPDLPAPPSPDRKNPDRRRLRSSCGSLHEEHKATGVAVPRVQELLVWSLRGTASQPACFSSRPARVARRPAQFRPRSGAGPDGYTWRHAKRKYSHQRACPRVPGVCSLIATGTGAQLGIF